MFFIFKFVAVCITEAAKGGGGLRITAGTILN